MMTLKKTIALLVLTLIIPGVALTQAGEINMSVAASMTDAFKKLADQFKQDHPNITIQYNFGSSGSLAKQITLGAPADIFVSANTKWMDYLIQKHMIDKDSVRVFAHNSLVFVGKKDTVASSLADLSGLGRIALGSPQSVPAGQYAEQAMRAEGIYDNLLYQNRLMMAKDVRQALMYADRGEVHGAFVYRTDALLAQHAVILFTVPQDLYTQIAYPLAMTVSGKDKADARMVYQFLTSDGALKILESYGFEPPVNPVAIKP